ncbi:hypothetical protein LTR84_001686 [Exophiala bonariae]|uniref:Uncharacterized protein n=1 Tax=Exophiala bonariae TaxID=1690606 RepID=A0AAV9NB06_9EURO|nr:hypothetical protein LTR84_001686 [Exophiala bonariae]
MFRSDLELGLLLGTKVWCPIEEVPGYEVLVEMRQELPRDYCRSNQPPYRQVVPVLEEILLDTLSFANRLNRASRGPRKPTDYYFHQTVVLLGHRLLNLSTFVDSAFDSEFDKNLHLGLSTFVATFFIGPTHKISDFKLLAGILRTAAETSLSKDKANMEIMLWTLSLARADMFDEIGDDWLIQTAKSLISHLGIQSQEDFERMLHKYPWVDPLHSESAQKIFSDLCQHNSEIMKSLTNDV